MDLVTNLARLLGIKVSRRKSWGVFGGAVGSAGRDGRRTDAGQGVVGFEDWGDMWLVLTLRCADSKVWRSKGARGCS